MYNFAIWRRIMFTPFYIGIYSIIGLGKMYVYLDIRIQMALHVFLP